MDDTDCCIAYESTPFVSQPQNDQEFNLFEPSLQLATYVLARRQHRNICVHTRNDRCPKENMYVKLVIVKTKYMPQEVDIMEYLASRL